MHTLTFTSILKTIPKASQTSQDASRKSEHETRKVED